MEERNISIEEEGEKYCVENFEQEACGKCRSKINRAKKQVMCSDVK